MITAILRGPRNEVMTVILKIGYGLRRAEIWLGGKRKINVQTIHRCIAD